ncbi:MAG: damage-control phosphatase ARMT1 family protein [Candidatus Asgardarchaeia archaeon]
MKVDLICAGCTLNTIIRILEWSKLSKERKFEILKIMIKRLSEVFDENQSPALMSNPLFRELYNLIGDDDPFRDLKRRSNEIASKIVDRIEQEVFSKENRIDMLYHAIAAAIAGNIIDYSNPAHKFNLEELYDVYLDVLKKGFTINDFDKALSLIEKANLILYVGDNAGEIFFDRILVRVLKEQFNKKIVFVVRGGPISNDATMEDAEAAGLTNIVKVITTGRPYFGVDFNDVGEEFLEWYEKSDLIISKGQANFETFSYYKDVIKKPIIFLLKAKCLNIANYLKVPLGSHIIKVSEYLSS